MSEKRILVSIETDEWYPVYIISEETDRRWCVLVDEAFYEDYKRVEEEFEQIQEKLRKYFDQTV